MTLEEQVRRQMKVAEWVQSTAKTSFSLVEIAEPDLATDITEDERLAFDTGANIAAGVVINDLKERGLLDVEKFIDQL